MTQTRPETMPLVSPDSPLTDRQMLAHLLQHAEWMHARVTELLEQAERYRPLLELAEKRQQRWGFVTGADRAAPAPRRPRPGRIG